MSLEALAIREDRPLTHELDWDRGALCLVCAGAVHIRYAGLLGNSPCALDILGGSLDRSFLAYIRYYVGAIGRCLRLWA